MELELALTPAGCLGLIEVGGPEDGDRLQLSQAVVDSLKDGESAGSAELVLRLATFSGRDSPPLPRAPAFWRRFGELYLSELCHIPEPAGERLPQIPPPLDVLHEMVEAAPPMRGGEYLRVETLAALWEELDARVRSEVAAQRGGLVEWLKSRSPLWHRVGRVCFHLAENRRNLDCPFAFLATYAPRLMDGGRVQYQPLGKALEEYAGAKNRKLLINLLTPIQRAAERCAWVKDLVDSGSVFHALAWTPAEAHRFLQDAPALEDSGLLVRVPDWWTRRPARVQVGVSIGRKPPSMFGADAMLDFKAELTLDGEELTQGEWREILNGADGLVFLKGKWVEVDREKLTRALDHWRKVEKEAGDDGISFLKGMRLLAGAPLGGDAGGLFDGDGAEWSQVCAGKWLEERLRLIRQPDAIDATVPPPELRATLRRYQEAGVKWLWLLTQLGLGACLADDMGLGKTVQVLALLLMLKRQPSKNPRPALLVLPASLLANWKSEIERFAPTLVCRFMHPSQMKPAELTAAAKSPAAFLTGVDAILTTYSMVSRLKWLSSVEWSLAILDEAQAVKNPAARQTRAVKQIKATARIALTGTPVENRLTDLWSIFDFTVPGLLGPVKQFGSFVKRLEQRPENQYGPLRKLVSPYILRRLKTDKSIIADLPDKTEVQAFCGLSKKQAALYEQSVRELEGTLKESHDPDRTTRSGGAGGIARRGMILAFILRFKQICNHPAQWLALNDYAPGDSGKFRRLREICEEIASRQDKALIFTQFREICNPLADYLGSIFGRGGLVLHGGTPVQRRMQLVDLPERRWSSDPVSEPPHAFP